MKTIKIYDGLLMLRLRLETDASGFTLRQLYREMEFSKDIDIWVFDSPTGNLKRRAIFPDYKMNRRKPREDVFAFINLWKEIVKLSPAFSIEVNGYEADDVIAHLAKRYGGMGYPVEVLSNDGDLRQLELLQNVTTPMASHKHVPPELIKLYKATVGDPSDNIPGVAGFGKQTWDTCDKEALLAYFTDEGEVPADLPPRVQRAMEANRGLYWQLWEIVGFLDIPDDVVTRALFRGLSKPDEAKAILDNFLQ